MLRLLQNILVTLTILLVSAAILRGFHSFQLNGMNEIGQFFILLSTVCLVSIAFLKISFRKNLSTRLALTSIFFFAVLIRFSWIMIFSSYHTSDFNTYLRCGIQYLESVPVDERNYCNIIVGGSPLYWMRSLFFTVPMAELLGTSSWSIGITNNLFFSGTLLNGIFITSRIVPIRVAIASSLVLLLNADLWYASTLASHDNPGIFWLSVFFSITIGVHKLAVESRLRAGRLIFLGFALGLIIMLLDFQRSYQMGAVLSLVALLVSILNKNWLNLSKKSVALIVCSILVLPFATYKLSSEAITRSYEPAKNSKKSYDLLTLFSATNIYTSNNYFDIFPWVNILSPMLDREDKAKLQIKKLTFEFLADPPELAKFLLRKNTLLNQPFDYLIWSTAKPEENTFTKTASPPIRWYNAQRATIIIASIFMLLVFGFRLLLIPKIPIHGFLITTIAFSAFTYFTLLFLGETQGRYRIYLVFLNMVFFGEILHFFLRKGRHLLPDFKEILSLNIKPLGRGLGAIVLIFCALMIGKLAAPSLGLVALNRAILDAPPCNADGVRVVENRFNSLKISLGQMRCPEQGFSLQQPIGAPKGAKLLMFLSVPESERSGDELLISIDEGPTQTIKWAPGFNLITYSFEAEGSPTSKIRIKINTLKKNEKNYNFNSEISLLNAILI